MHQKRVMSPKQMVLMRILALKKMPKSRLPRKKSKFQMNRQMKQSQMTISLRKILMQSQRKSPRLIPKNSLIQSLRQGMPRKNRSRRLSRKSLLKRMYRKKLLPRQLPPMLLSYLPTKTWSP